MTELSDLRTKSFFPKLDRHVTDTKCGSKVVSYTSDLGPDAPILTLIHGYPQSAYIYRYMAPRLVQTFSLFIPEQPGYGISSPSTTSSSPLEIGNSLLEALRDAFSLSTGSQSRKLILGGHDRGARVAHRLAVAFQKDQGLDLVALVMLDIVPTKVQWDNFANPAIAAGYFHWPMLANVDVAVPLIKAFGGGNWCRSGLTRLAGTNDVGRKRLLEEDGGINVYATLFEDEETIKGTCEDYKAGAKLEYEEQKKDQEAGRKINVPTLVMFSEAKLGSTVDVEAVWKDWVAPGVYYEGIACQLGVGHYLPEEAGDFVSDRMLGFLAQHI